MELLERLKISCSESDFVLNPSCKTGTLAALYFKTCGAKAPGGSFRTLISHCVTVCESASSAWTLGWKWTGTTEIPGWDCDSMCSIPTTFDVKTRSKFVTMRVSISSGDRPPYCHTTLTTGMSM